MGTKVRLWRFRRNPLRRGTDRAEGWLLVAAGVLLAAGAPAAGVAAAAGMENAIRDESRDWRQVSAVLVEDAHVSFSTVVEDTGARATVRWKAPDGSTGKGVAVVERDTRAGTVIPVWTDEKGALRREPLTPAQARIEGAAVGVSTGVGVCAVVVVATWAAHCRLDRRREREWERDWARTEPQWSRRHA